MNQIVREKKDQNDQRNGIKKDITNQRPSGQTEKGKITQCN
jgi:hypothetical protein